MRSFAQSIVETVREPLLVLDAELHSAGGESKLLPVVPVIPEAD